MERLLDEISFHASRHTGETLAIDAAYVDAAPGRHRRRRQPRALHSLRRLVLERILGIILPVFLVVALGWV